MNNDELSTILTVLFLGISLGAFYAYYQKKFLGSFIRSLIKSKCLDEMTAKPLSDLGFRERSLKRRLLKGSLSEGKSLMRYVKKCDNGYYLPIESYEEAEHRYDDKGTTLTAVILTIVLFMLVAAIASFVIPALWSMASGIGDSFNTNKVNESGYTEVEKDDVNTADEVKDEVSETE